MNVQARMTISAALDRKKLTDVVRSIVDESKCLNFYSDRARKFISVSRPELRLLIDREATAEHHPDIYAEMVAANEDKEMIDAKTKLVVAEVQREIMDFFSGVFTLIIKGEYHAGLNDKQKAHVDSIVEGLDLDDLRATVNNIFKVRNKEGELTEELGFSYGIISAITFPSDEGEVMTNDLAIIEIVY